LKTLIAPDAIEGRQKMREKWLHQVFDQADSDRKGMLDEWEIIALMKKLNDKLCIRSLKQKIMEFEFGKEEEERGRISKNVFITLFTETATRPDIYFILVRYQILIHFQWMTTFSSNLFTLLFTLFSLTNYNIY
jgi:hypothetical protein